MIMCDKEILVGYLYDELPRTDRLTFEGHLAQCAQCRDELSGLRATRTQLAEWAPPEPELAFQIVRGVVAPPAPSRFRAPAWGLAAAAVLLLAVASAIANVEVKYGADGLTMRTGWNKTVTAQPPADTTANAVSSDGLRTELVALQQRIRALESASQDKSAAHDVLAKTSDPGVLRQVRQIVADSEARQERELALRITQLLRDFEATRRTDLQRIQQNFAQVQGLTDTTILRQRAIQDQLQLIRVANQK
jgi:anti-sigma factor RsiW